MAIPNSGSGRGAMLMSLRVALAVGFVALGVALSTFSIPIGPAKVFPFQHMINVLVAILLGPVDAMIVAAIVGIIRNALGTGTVLAFAGIFGGLIVGVVYWHLWRSDHAAWLESIGTVVIGATLGYMLLAPLPEPTTFLGFMPGRPPTPFSITGFVELGGMMGLWAAFAVSSIPGSALGFVILGTLRRAGLILPRVHPRG